MTAAERFVRTGDIVTHCALDGAGGGLALVFANSLGTDFRIWNGVVAALRGGRAAAGLTILRYDKRGHGLTEGGGAAYTVEGLARDLGALIDHFGLREIILCGVSVGGQIAQALYAQRPDTVRGLVLCDTAAKIGDAASWGDRIAALRAGGIEAIADGILERWFGPAFRAANPDALAGWRTMLTRTPLDGYIGVCEALKAADLTEATARIAAPALVVCGGDDGATPPDMVEAFAGLLPDARYATIADAGHLPSIEQPEALAREIRQFLEEKRLV